MRREKSWSFEESFFSLFWGIITLSSLIAIVKTGGLTIMIGFVMIAIFYLWEQKKNLTSERNVSTSNKTIAFCLIVGSLFVFTWSFFSLVQFDSFPYHISEGVAMSSNDYLINSFRSYYLGISGEENYYHVLNTLDDAYNGPKPYHYFEMWTTVAVTKVFGGFAAERFVLISNPLYHLTAFVAVLALWEKYVIVKWYHLLLSMLFMFFAGLYLPFYYQLGIPDFSLPMFTHRLKMYVYYIFILAFLLRMNDKKPQQAILLLLGLMIATVVAVPSLIGGLGVYAAYLFFKNKRVSLITMTYTICIGAFIFLFYKFTDTGQLNIRANAGANELVSNIWLLIADNPLQKIGLIFKTLIGHGFLYLPFLLLLALMYKEGKDLFLSKISIGLISVGVLLSGALAYAIFYNQLDASQLFYNMANPMLNCLMIWAVIRFVSDRFGNRTNTRLSMKHASLGVLFFLMFSIQSFAALKRNIVPSLATEAYSNEYLNKVKTYITKDKKPNLGASIKGGVDYNSSFSKQTAAYTLGYYLAFIENGSIAIQISDFDIPNLDKSGEEDRETSLFYKFVSSQKDVGSFLSIGQSQVDFIKKYNLDFVVVSKNGRLRSEVQNLVEDEIFDEISEERFLSLKTDGDSGL